MAHIGGIIPPNIIPHHQEKFIHQIKVYQNEKAGNSGEY